ncbi:nucleoside triphosphate pyrophosphohydrolase [Aestuariibacter halophilus]|uniref:Nucleoside triphosphate pyrophosphohydrolase n=1 Tax=Fluctibacter halophilus TaxID=226011 RepID=A0ABS8GB15_9ALTE|nr:nucleoside triphosphate pyrophosphohydrolase [Aestuariibacter halophilus]MCC2617782.1 nucleoside triphosphate pyrophosphohydrolase [Aestuariibacter halophilus]
MAGLPQTERLLNIMRALRDPDGGCPWDRAQTFSSIVPHTLEEAYELADAIASGDREDICDELGDVLFQVVFYAQLGQEEGAFDFERVAGSIADKLERRHPHVFANQSVDEQDLHRQWEAIKQQERAQKGHQDTSILANVPTGMAPLLRAQKLQKQCAKVGFDWDSALPVLDKVREEVDECGEELAAESMDTTALAEEIGDLLFAVVNLARHVGVNPEQALVDANRKFERRFRGVEAQLGSRLQDASLQEMEEAWQQVKGNESSN